MTIRAIDLQRLVNQYGESLRLISKTFGPYNPATGSSVHTEVSTSFIGYMASYNLSDIDGTNIIRGDRKLVMGPYDSCGMPISPEVDDEVVGAGDRVSIVSVSKIISNGAVLSYICQVRE